MKLAFIGGGNMATALIAGLKNQQFNAADITVVELDADKRAQLTQQFGVNETSDIACVANIDVIVLAIKPQQLPGLAKTLAPILSIKIHHSLKVLIVLVVFLLILIVSILIILEIISFF